MPQKTPKNIAISHIKTLEDTGEYRLDSNGLRILLLCDHAAPVVNVMVTYHVGSRNEAVGYTGATHLLEHLMFKGSKRFNKKNKKQIWNILEARGARLNATTWLDRTNYYETIPNEHLKDALAIEADRMRNAFITEADRATEMTVVRNEFEWGENDPFQVLDRNIWATAYQAHPYHHSTIGWRSDIENVPIERLKEFYDTFYWPNNATLSLIGNFEKEWAFSLIREHFGRIPSSPHPIPLMYTVEPKQEGERRFAVSRTGQTRIVGVAHKIPHGLHADTAAIQVLATILARGKSSRLYRALVDTGLASGVSPWATPFHDNGLFITYATLTRSTSFEKVERIIKTQYEAVKKQSVTAAEVAKARAQVAAASALSRDGCYQIASVLNEAIALGDWTFYHTFKNRVDTVTPEDVSRVARTYFADDQNTTGFFIPKKQTTKHS